MNEIFEFNKDLNFQGFKPKNYITNVLLNRRATDRPLQNDRRLLIRNVQENIAREATHEQFFSKLTLFFITKIITQK